MRDYNVAWGEFIDQPVLFSKFCFILASGCSLSVLIGYKEVSHSKPDAECRDSVEYRIPAVLTQLCDNKYKN
jgi:hypothetical protein